MDFESANIGIFFDMERKITDCSLNRAITSVEVFLRYVGKKHYLCILIH